MEAGKTRIELTGGWSADEEEPGPLSPAILWRKDWDAALDDGTRLLPFAAADEEKGLEEAQRKRKFPTCFSCFTSGYYLRFLCRCTD
jgi:hypothetical protein